MKKILFFSTVTLALMGCGGGADTAVELERTATGTQATLDKNTETVKDVESNVVPKAAEKPYEEVADPSHPYPAPSVSKETKEMILEVINAARAEGQDCGKMDTHGVPVKDSTGRYIYDGSNIMAPTTPLVWNDALYTAAYEHSDDLAQSDTASHSGSGTEFDWTGMDMGGTKSNFVDRARNNGYRNFTRLGENISLGTRRDTINAAVDSWLKSPGHCVNLMNPVYTEVGVGHVENIDAYYGHYWTQELGRSAK